MNVETARNLLSSSPDDVESRNTHEIFWWWFTTGVFVLAIVTVTLLIAHYA